jgi:signal transduction histidine kinase
MDAGSGVQIIGVRVKFNAKFYSDPDYLSEVALVIEDDGPGMSQEEIALFGQRRRRRIKLSSGAGINVSLGLGSVIMKTITELHGGSIAIESALTGESPSNGTRFTITLRR